MSDYILISYRTVNATYFPSIVADEAMTGEKILNEAGAAFKTPHVSVFRFGVFHRFWEFADMERVRNVMLERQHQSNILPLFTQKVWSHYEVADKKLAVGVEYATKQQLYDLYITLLEEYRNICVYSYPANLMDRPLTDTVKNEVLKLKSDISEAEIDKLLLALTRNPEANFMYDFDLGSIELILGSASQEAIDTHINTWKTLFVGDAGSTGDYGKKLAKQRFDSLKDLPTETLLAKKQDIKSQYNQSKDEIRRIEKSLSIPDQLKNNLNLLRLSILLKETRKLCMLRLESAAKPLFEAIGKHTNIKPSNIAYMLPNEVKDVLIDSGNSISDERIEEFKNDLAYVIQHGVTKRYDGQEVDTVIEKYGIENDVKARDSVNTSTSANRGSFKGFVSCLGYVEGPVKIINGSKDFHKINDGDVLVTHITTPEYVAIFDKVKGMITYDGAGITSHPATLSREYKIPAILGVKELNGVIKDNDIVSIDADKNEINILT